ncbi:MAG: hypothetical protein LIQ30_03790 [Planctomycetes bacterium]|nr:hypothetical protein [Planctomycetota bacterium]MCC8117115.1 hypothetical protein [Planctomycetota bacterium]MCD7896545.1 hypothetical protein [Planctomycetaceae bacterium]
MTSVTKKTRGTKGKKPRMPLPTSADKAIIAGTEYVIIPSAEFEEWYVDQILAAVANDRLKTERAKAAPWNEVVTRLKKKNAAKGKGT